MDRDFNKVQQYKHENQKLKKEIARLRKELDRVHNRYDNLDEIVQQQYDEEYPPSKSKQSKDWSCFKCKEGQLKLIIMNRPDGCFYLRKCSNCENKTRLKKYTEGVSE